MVRCCCRRCCCCCCCCCSCLALVPVLKEWISVYPILWIGRRLSLLFSPVLNVIKLSPLASESLFRLMLLIPRPCCPRRRAGCDARINTRRGRTPRLVVRFPYKLDIGTLVLGGVSSAAPLGRIWCCRHGWLVGGGGCHGWRQTAWSSHGFLRRPSIEFLSLVCFV